jgi:hypothetical protein
VLRVRGDSSIIRYIPLRHRLVTCYLTDFIHHGIDYLDQQSNLQGQHPGVKVHNNDFIGAASYNIFVGISVATIFGAAFFFDLFWPARYESPSVRLAWKICAVVVSVMMLSSALTMTV